MPFSTRRSSTRGTPRGFLGRSGAITRHSKSVRSYRLMHMLNQISHATPIPFMGLAAYHRVLAIYPFREFAEVGGLLSYGASKTDANRQTGVYTGRILKAEKPADLAVMRSTKLEFVINLNTAKAFGISFPPGLLAIADEVID